MDEKQKKMKRIKTLKSYTLYTLLCVVFFTIHYLVGVAIFKDYYWVLKINLILRIDILLLLIGTVLFVDTLVNEHLYENKVKKKLGK